MCLCQCVLSLTAVVGVAAPKTKEEKYAMIFSSKVATDIDMLCRGLPPQFGDYLRYCRSLGYEEVPVASCAVSCVLERQWGAR